MRLPIARQAGHHPNGMIKIGAVAERFSVSVDLLRLYEREGLLIPLKSKAGTRYFTEQDYPWISTLLRLVREARLNFRGILHLLALLPCWQLRACGCQAKASCPGIRDSTQPCWMNHNQCPHGGAHDDCYFCPVYRAAPSCENLKAVLAVSGPIHTSSHSGADSDPTTL